MQATAVRAPARPRPRGPARPRYRRRQSFLSTVCAAFSRALQHHHAELLRAQPAGTARMRDRDGVGVEKGEMAADQRAVGDDVRTRQRKIEAALRRRRVDTRRGIVKARRSRAARLGGLRHRPQKRDLRRIGGGEQVAAAIQIEAVAGLPRQIFDQVDAAVHEGRHRPIRTRPPVAIGFGRFVGRERQRIARLDNRHVGDAMLGHERMSGRDPGDAGAADDDFRRGLGHALRPQPEYWVVSTINGAPEEIRTPDPQILRIVFGARFGALERYQPR